MINKHIELLYLAFALTLLLASLPVYAKPWDHGRLVVNFDEDIEDINELSGRFLRHEDGTPFFWMGDTAWGIFRNSFLDAAPNQGQPFPMNSYFAARAAQGFNVVQTQLLPFTEIREDTIPGTQDANINAYGAMAFQGGNTSGNFRQPIINPGIGINDYWDYVDSVLDAAEANGIYVSIVPAWNNHLPGNVEGQPRTPKVVTNPAVAYDYGYFLGARYGNRPNLIWMLGGDAYSLAKQINSRFREQLRDMNGAMAEGIADGANGVNNQNGTADYTTTLMTLHPRGGRSSKELREYQQAQWMDFDAIQTAISADSLSSADNDHTFDTVTRDYESAPLRPTLESEVSYENAFRTFRDPPREVDTIPITSWEARRSGYLSVFAGSLGYTYGHNNIIQFLRAGQTAHNGSANGPWFESMGIDMNSENCLADFASCLTTTGTISGEGANTMRHLRNLIESRFTSNDEGGLIQNRVPDQGMILQSNQRDMDRFSRIQATRSSNRNYIMIYTANGDDFRVDLSQLSAREFNAWWYNPRDGRVYGEGTGETPSDQPFLQCAANEGNAISFTPPGDASPSISSIVDGILRAIGLGHSQLQDNSIGNDWVLVLDDANAGFGIPGRPGTTLLPKCDGTDAVENPANPAAPPAAPVTLDNTLNSLGNLIGGLLGGGQ